MTASVRLSAYAPLMNIQNIKKVKNIQKFKKIKNIQNIKNMKNIKTSTLTLTSAFDLDLKGKEKATTSDFKTRFWTFDLEL